MTLRELLTYYRDTVDWLSDYFNETGSSIDASWRDLVAKLFNGDLLDLTIGQALFLFILVFGICAALYEKILGSIIFWRKRNERGH